MSVTKTVGFRQPWKLETVQMQVDIGVSYNVLPLRYWLNTLSTQIGRTKRELVTYSKSKLSVVGTATEPAGNPRNYLEYTVKFVVVEDGFKPLLVAAATHKIWL